ncbi:MAG: radical SAM protein [Clostridiales bacterium]|nr:radical SAM protein [Clostridiales bacterium]
MKKKNIYMVQATNASEKNVYLPYSTGTLVANAWKDSKVQDSYDFKGFIVIKEDIEEIARSFDEPFLIGFSNNIWNSNFNKLLAERIKCLYPNCLILFGGKELPFGNDYLERYPYMDFLIHLWGEETFRLLLLELAHGGTTFSEIPNLSYRENGKAVTNAVSCEDSLDFPSPYLSGLYDELIKSAPQINFVAGFETNRGCPFHCTYCDWDTAKAKMVLFPLEKVFAEIEWIAAHKIDYCGCFDSNFGIFERDELIADKLIEVKKRTGFPIKLQVSAAKADSEIVYRINRKLNECKMSKGVTISVQTLCPEALFNIDRQNISLDDYQRLMVLYKTQNIPTFTDVILGLPGETYESFCSGLCKLIECGQHFAIFVYSCNLLTNSIMWQKPYIEKHGIKTVDIPFSQYHCNIRKSNEPAEYSKEIIATSTMNEREFLRAKYFAHVLQCFHCFGLLRCFAIYLYHEKHVSYLDFYKALVEHLGSVPQSVAGAVFSKVYKGLESYSRGEEIERFVDPIFGDITWPFEEGAYLEILLKLDRFYEEAESFLQNFDIEPEIFDELMRYQKSIIKLPGRETVKLELEYDLGNYFYGIFAREHTPPQRKRNIVTIGAGGVPDNWKDYSKYIVWFGRKGTGNVSSDVSVDLV